MAATSSEQLTIAQIETELARKHNWAQQEQFWQAQQRHFVWNQRFWMAVVALTALGLILNFLK